ncbi:Uncharacterised protein [Aedoeadaptatus ivorii]|uniref:Uncharacterized protein n=1 Tax=Aedoeadaptatus ivorii TaxID=54006 RepID=A0A448V049_9FIRM|nr:CBO2463/CBO2479 domain-containing protein [Peptoniphilus ivorii]MDQ0507992.1 hypothetical protein [Peptoniphilus ivorii]VEJ34845.1 Uncharacterised protein [Peptoniphilus ivorii]
MEKLRYVSSETYIEGIIVRLTEASVTIDFKGRMGQLKVPLRYIISDYPLEEGMEIGMLMSMPEVISPDVNEGYQRNIELRRERGLED